MCYTYDNLSRVTARTVKKLSDNSVVSTETFNYDPAGNVTSAPDSSFQYDTNNRLVVFNGNSVSYDLDGNMLNNGVKSFTYDSANRLITADGHTYTYNAEDVRIRNLCAEEDTTYIYNTNAKLSMLLMKTTNGVVTKYVYGKGLICEEVSGVFKTYHFDCRGSTIAITDASGNITDTFAYDTYGKLLTRTGTSEIIFGYNGRDGVVTDDNGLIYMRARYYSPNMKRFINADIIPGKLSNAITLNRFAYANGNPVSFIDPFGLSSRHNSIWSLKNDKFGREILWHWLFNEGEDFIREDGEWGEYMKENELLDSKIKEIVLPLADKLENNSELNVDITTSMVIQNGEDIIGYQYLHGTNADVGGFQIKGTILKSSDGDITYKLTYTWNDIIDPNFKYHSDSKKSKFAQSIPFANPTDYTIRITWSETFSVEAASTEESSKNTRSK